jgi:guanylate kinase
MKNMPRVIFLMGNSGAGKSTLEKKLIMNFPNLFKKVISHTTRPIDKKNRKEKDGVHYHFITEEQYDLLEKNGDLIQKTEYGKYRYGSILKEYQTNKPYVIVAIVPERVDALKKELKKRGYKKFTNLLLNISKDKIYENLYNSGETKESIENRFKRGDLIEQFKKNKLVADIELKDCDLNANIHKTVLKQLEKII